MLFLTSSIPSPQLPPNQDNFGFLKTKKSKTLLVGDDTDLLPALEADTNLFYHTTGKWSTHQLAKLVLDQTGPAELILTTWAITEKPLRTLLNLKQSGKITILKGLFEHKIKSHNSKSFAFAQGFFDLVKLTKIHAKITLIKNQHWTITIVGTSNWTINRRIEGGVLSTDKEVYDFYLEMIEKHLHE